jgi:hypothetical protein
VTTIHNRPRTSAARRRSDESGDMSEINFLVWPLVYGVAGHAWGVRLGHPALGTVIGVLAGYVTAVPFHAAPTFDVEIYAPLLLIATVLVPRGMRLWYLIGLCVLPWGRLALRVVKEGLAADRQTYLASLEKIKAEAERMRKQLDAPGSEAGLVSDFEEENPSARFGSGWSVELTGGKSTAEFKVVPGGANDSRGSLLITGEIRPECAGAMFSPGAAKMTPADLSSKKEISFWAKGDGKTYRIRLYAGQVFDYRMRSKTFMAGPEWKQFTFQFSEFDGMDGSDLMGILFAGGSEAGSFAFQIDDVRFN